MKFPSRCRQKTNITHIECPYCKYTYPIHEEVDDDYTIVENTKVHWCRRCGWQFINGITKDIQYKYS